MQQASTLASEMGLSTLVSSVINTTNHLDAQKEEAKQEDKRKTPELSKFRSFGRARGIDEINFVQIATTCLAQGFLDGGNWHSELHILLSRPRCGAIHSLERASEISHLFCNRVHGRIRGRGYRGCRNRRRNDHRGRHAPFDSF